MSQSGFGGLAGNPVLRYVAILGAARDLGVSRRDIEALAGPFDATETRCDELADALAELVMGSPRTA